MKLILQRVSAGNVTVEGQIVGQIGPGYVILAGITHTDTEAVAKKLAAKVVHLRVFSDEAGKMNRSLLDVRGEILLISQFTLYADTRRGRRPSYTDAARPEIAKPLLDYFAEALRQLGIAKVATGIFGADMQVEIHNDGPVTIILEEN